MPDKSFLGIKHSANRPAKSNMSFLQPIESRSTDKTAKPLTILSLISLSSTGFLLTSFHQSAIAADSSPENNFNTLEQLSLSNIIDRVKDRLFPQLTTQLPPTFAPLHLSTSWENSHPSENKTLVNSGIGGEAPSDRSWVTQLPPLTLANAAIKSPFSPGIHVVKPGETLSKIARQYGTSTEALLAINPLENPNLISIGRELNIPQISPERAIATQTLLSSPLSISPEALPSLQQPESDNSTILEPSVTLASSSSKGAIESSTAASTNPYIAKLRNDIEQIRDRYQQELQGDRASGRISSLQSATERLSDRNFSLRDLPPTEFLTQPDKNKTSVGNSEKPSAEKEFLSVAPSATPSYQTVLPTTTTATTATILQPELPPLPPSNTYLPVVFNGYHWPAQGTLTSGYGWRWGRMHNGIDIAGPIGTPVIAAASGEVIFSGWNSGGYGNLIKIRHPDSSVTLYAHNNKNIVVEGEQILQGQQIAEMGSTGYSTGSHLHFEIHPNGDSAVNPIAFLPEDN
jgi:murein DD-endopeptidase MepM/ murein hydrolase activator NlpD